MCGHRLNMLRHGNKLLSNEVVTINPFFEQIVNQIMASMIGGLIAAIIAAVSVGGVIWKKLNANKLQDDRIAKIEKNLSELSEIIQVMSCQQLQVACNRAIEKGFISLSNKQEIEKLYSLYDKQNWNGPGKVAHDSMSELPVRDD